MRKFFIIILTVFIALLGAMASPKVNAQDALEQRVDRLETKVQNLEDYIQRLQPTLNEFSEDLLNNVDIRMRSVTGKVVVLNAVSKKVSKIETNTGNFLIAVEKMDKLQGGYRLSLQIGNPNAATFSGVKLVLRWGEKWDPSFVKPTYEQWRQSLQAAEYTYPGSLEPGNWTDVKVDLVPADYNQIEYIECEMDVTTIKLQKTP